MFNMYYVNIYIYICVYIYMSYYCPIMYFYHISIYIYYVYIFNLSMLICSTYGIFNDMYHQNYPNGETIPYIIEHN